MSAAAPDAQDLATASMAALDTWWDPELNLLTDPPTGEPPRRTRVRESALYALGLLARGGSGDRERAVLALRAVLDHQLDQPGTPWHGTWLRFPEEPVPDHTSREWRDYDPNWREFIGCTLLLVLELDRAEDRLPADLVAGIDRALDRAVAGSLARGVSPLYSNIALMAAFLQHAVGRRRGDSATDAAGVDLMRQVLEAFEVHGAFEEYNSPTYYGVDLYALALWRRYGAEPRTQERACAVEIALWRDIAAHHHAGLQNLAGPYDRSYGMDLRDYSGAVGLWLWLAQGRRGAVYPDLDRPHQHQWDLGLGPSVALLGLPELPAEVRAELDAFSGPRTVEQPIDGRRVARSVLEQNLIVGAEHVGGDRGNLRDQFHPLTAHWRLAGGVGWLRLVSPLTIDVVAERAGDDAVDVSLRWADGGELAFQVRADGFDAAAVAARRWDLPGLAVDVETTAVLERVEAAPDGTWWLHYVAAAGAEGVADLALSWSDPAGSH